MSTALTQDDVLNTICDAANAWAAAFQEGVHCRVWNYRVLRVEFLSELARSRLRSGAYAKHYKFSLGP
jgi:hypothetical protein